MLCIGLQRASRTPDGFKIHFLGPFSEPEIIIVHNIWIQLNLLFIFQWPLWISRPKTLSHYLFLGVSGSTTPRRSSLVAQNRLKGQADNNATSTFRTKTIPQSDRRSQTILRIFAISMGQKKRDSLKKNRTKNGIWLRNEATTKKVTSSSGGQLIRSIVKC